MVGVAAHAVARCWRARLAQRVLIVTVLVSAVVSGAVEEERTVDVRVGVGRFLQGASEGEFSTTNSTRSFAEGTCFKYQSKDTCISSWIDRCRIVANVTAGNINYNFLLSKVFSSLSFVGGVFTLVTYCVSPVVRNPQILVEVQLALTCLLSNVKSFFGGLYDVYDVETCCPTTPCQVEAAVENFAPLAAIMWSGVIAVQAYLLIVIGMIPKQMDQVYKYFYIVGYGLPFVFTLWPLIAGYFGPAGLFCWIPSSEIWQQIVFYYMWLFVVDLAIMGLLIHIGFAVRGTKSTGVINRFIGYAVWAVFCTFGFIIMRTGEWALGSCSEWPPAALLSWNSIWFPAQGLGYSVIFAMNRNVHQGWTDAFTKCKKTSLAGADKSATYGDHMEMSTVNNTATAVSDEQIVAKVSEEGYSDDDLSD